MKKRKEAILVCMLLILSSLVIVFPVKTVKANQPPNIPTYLNPSNHETNVDIDEDLIWICSDPDGDILFYDVYFGTSSYPPLVIKDSRAHSYPPPGGMNLSTKYYWKIVAKDEHGASTIGPIWDFTTEAHHNNPPYTPRGPNPHDHATYIDINTNLSFYNSGDPDVNDTVTYDVYIGSIPPLQKIASNISTTTINPGTLADRLTYFWKVVAWDNHGASEVGPVWDFTTRNIDYNTLYAGGSGPGNYTTIQSAIDDTYSGDTVFVYSGTYYENVKVNVSINLIGENKNTTIIEGEGTSDVLFISVDFVHISGFTIQNGRTGIVLGYSSNSIISGNIASNNNNTGILLFHSSNNTISGNTASNNGNCGIDLCYSSSNNIISGNIASNNNNGIWLFQSSSNNIISGNIISNNDFGIWVLHSSNNTISGNIASNNLYGILLDTSNNTRNIENNFINNIRANAYFESSYKIKWERNYWDDWKGIGPKVIKGKISIDFLPELDDISWINFDWHPAKEPYNILKTLTIIVSKSPIYEGETLTVTVKSEEVAVKDIDVKFGSLTAKTDVNGKVNFIVPDPGVESATYYIKAEKEGYITAETSVTVLKLPIISFVADDIKNTLIVVFESPLNLSWSDIEITGDCNLSSLGEKVRAGDTITDCHGIIRIIFISLNLLLEEFNFSDG